MAKTHPSKSCNILSMPLMPSMPSMLPFLSMLSMLLCVTVTVTSTPFTRIPAPRHRILSGLWEARGNSTRMMDLFATKRPPKDISKTLTSFTSLQAVASTNDQPLQQQHLQLQSEAMLPNKDQELSSEIKKDQAILHTYKAKSPHSNSLSGLNVSREKFIQWLHHCLPKGTKLDLADITSEDISIQTTRQHLRTLWKARRLLCDRTELLTVYQSDIQTTQNGELHKRGGFTDLLHLYADRHVAIVQDERNDAPDAILQWLTSEYNATSQLDASHLLLQTPDTQLVILQSFLDWFRNTFPYYYDKCHACGASCKHDGIEDGSFLGYVYPNDEEQAGKAGRTEIYICHKCSAVTRFPRFNAASHVLQHQRGRCGEYSMLLYRMLRALGHDVRWIVDWADHVWCELHWQGRWMHVDPCEATMDAPLLYQEWGKQQTYIMAFYAPRLSNADKSHQYPTIEDVTANYTSDGMDTIQERRDASAEHVDATIAKVSLDLEQKLANALM